MPKWIWPVAATLIFALSSVSAGLIVFIFVRLDNRVEKMGEEFGTLQQRVAVMDSKLDSYAAVARQTKGK